MKITVEQQTPEVHAAMVASTERPEERVPNPDTAGIIGLTDELVYPDEAELIRKALFAYHANETMTFHSICHELMDLRLDAMAQQYRIAAEKAALGH